MRKALSSGPAAWAVMPRLAPLCSLIVCGAFLLLSQPAQGEPEDPRPTEAAAVGVRDRVAFELRAPRGAASAAVRAKAASAILNQVLAEPRAAPEVTIVPVPSDSGERTLRIAGRDVLTLGPADVAVSGLTPEVYYDAVRSEVSGFLTRERRRAALQAWVTAVSMVVLLGLCAVLLLRWALRRITELQEVLREKAAAGSGLRIRQITVLSAQAIESGAYLLLVGARLALLVGVSYAYLAYAFSQFQATRPLVRRLTELLLGPFGVLLERAGLALPALLLLVISGYALRAALQLVGLFFDHVSRGQVQVAWMPADLAAAARPVGRIALFIAGLLLLSPLISGSGGGLFTWIGLLLLAALGLGAVPLCAAACAGALAIFTRRFHEGEWVKIGDHEGEIAIITFFDLVLVPAAGGRLRVPHLLCLFVPVRHMHDAPPVVLFVPLDPQVAPEGAEVALSASVAPLARSVEVHLESLSAAAARYRITLHDPQPGAAAAAMARVARALREAGIALGAGPVSP